jgi:hypothetical protein
MSIEPYLRAAGDGTYELVVPSKGGKVHVLPYCFHSNEDAVNWLATPKGRERIEKLRNVSRWRKTAHKLFKLRSEITVLDIR